MCSANVDKEEGQCEHQGGGDSSCEGCSFSKEHPEKSCDHKDKILEVVQNEPVQELCEIVDFLRSGGTMRVGSEVRVQENIGVNVYAVPVVQSAGNSEVDYPGNKGEKCSEKKPSGELCKLAEAPAGQNDGKSKAKEKSHQGEFYAEYKAAAEAGEENISRGKFRPAAMLQRAQKHIQGKQKKRQADFLCAAAPVEAFGCTHAGKKNRREKGCGLRPAEKLQNPANQEKIRSAEENFHEEHTAEGGSGHQGTQAIEKIEVGALLVKDVAVDENAVKHGFSH